MQAGEVCLPFSFEQTFSVLIKCLLKGRISGLVGEEVKLFVQERIKIQGFTLLCAAREVVPEHQIPQSDPCTENVLV